jgi:hypothetical protein
VPVVTRRHDNHELDAPTVGDRQEVEAVAAIGQADAMVSTSDEFFPYRFGRKPQPALPADVVAELEAEIAAIVALVAGSPAPLFLRDPSPEFLAASSNHMALRSFASNSTFNFPSSVKA